MTGLPQLEKASVIPSNRHLRKPRLGFLGVGWIGRNRLEAVIEKSTVECVAIAEPNDDLAQAALNCAHSAEIVTSLDELIEFDLDGIVIATPSAMHAEQAKRALDSGLAVFCQKPLGRNAAETDEVIRSARNADRLLGVDLSYRYLSEVQAVSDLVRSGALGEIFAIELIFHNAYGPDKDWFYNRQLSGGGCVIDLGIHLVDLALWVLNFPSVTEVSSTLFHRGRRLAANPEEVEDFAAAHFHVGTRAVAQLSCSWRLPAGQDAVISASFYGTNGAARVSNIDGSFYRFRAERFSGTTREVISEDSGNWGGGAILDWVSKLNQSPSFDATIENLVTVARTLDAIYQGGNGHA
jgi:predicted dehydrogenase